MQKKNTSPYVRTHREHLHENSRICQTFEIFGKCTNYAGNIFEHVNSVLAMIFAFIYHMRYSSKKNPSYKQQANMKKIAL